MSLGRCDCLSPYSGWGDTHGGKGKASHTCRGLASVAGSFLVMGVRTMSFLQIVKEKWEPAKPILKGLVLGLIAGPIIVFWMGGAVTPGTMQEEVRTAIVDTKASICAARARAEVKDPAKLDYDARNKLTAKWSTMPGQKPGSADDDVMSACAEKLS